MKLKRPVLLLLLSVAFVSLAVASFLFVNGRSPVVATTPATAAATSQTRPASTTAATVPKAPLTGQPLTEAARRERGAVIVKVEDAPQARPQFGMEKADVVIEEKVEGGQSRFMAIFHSQDSPQVGPIRSLRSTDIYALRPLGGGILGFSGGIGPFKAMLPSSNLVDSSADARPGAYSRMKGRPAVHDLYSSTDRLRQATAKSVAAPKPLFSFLDGQPFAPSGSSPVTGISGSMGPGNQFDWSWDPNAKVWKRGSNGRAHNLVSGQIAATNVIVQFVPYRATPYKDRANTSVDEAVLDGTGDSWVLSDGKLVAGRWVRPTLDQPTSFNDAAGQPVQLSPGTTWLVLIPAGNAVAINR